MTQISLDPEKVKDVADRLLCGLIEQDIHEMAALYARRYSTYGIADRMGVDSQTVVRILRAVGVQLRRPGSQTVLTPEIRQAAKEMIAGGKSARAAALAVGVSPSTIQVAVREGSL